MTDKKLLKEIEDLMIEFLVVYTLMIATNVLKEIIPKLEVNK